MPPTYFKRFLLVIALLLATVPSTAPATTLQDLFGGNSITVGNARFSNWELVQLDATASPGPFLSQIFVTPIAGDINQPGLLYSTNGHLATTGINAINMQLRFRVTSLPGGKAFVGQSLGLNGITTSGPAGMAYVSQENASLSGADLGATLVMADNETDFVLDADLESFTHQFGLSVTMSVFVTGVTATDSISLTSFSQLFSQTGPESIAGDFDFDGDVDGRDFLVWQRGGSPSPLSAGDLADWQAGYGVDSFLAIVSDSTTRSVVQRAVPEPSAFVLALPGTIAALLGRRRQWQTRLLPRAELK